MSQNILLASTEAVQDELLVLKDPSNHCQFVFDVLDFANALHLSSNIAQLIFQERGEALMIILGTMLSTVLSGLKRCIGINLLLLL